MSPQTNRQIQAVSDDLSQLGNQLREIAREQLPRITDAAQRAGQSVARASSAAGRSAARNLSLVPPVIGAKANALRKSGLLTASLGLVARRPMLAATAGLAVAGIGLAIWRSTRAKAEDIPEEAKQSPAGAKRTRK